MTQMHLLAGSQLVLSLPRDAPFLPPRPILTSQKNALDSFLPFLSSHGFLSPLLVVFYA